MLALPIWRVTLSNALQDQDFDKFINIMTSAALFGMPKVLACCEYYVAVDTYKEAHMGLATQTELGARCSREELLDCSRGRIGDGLAIAIHGMYGTQRDKYSDVTPCGCECCKRICKTLGKTSCSCSKKTVSLKTMAQLVPRPMEFLEMAMAERVSQKTTTSQDVVN